MRSETALKRLEEALGRAIVATQTGKVSYRKAAVISKVCKSTVWDRVQKKKKLPKSRTSLNPVKEALILGFLLRCAKKGFLVGVVIW